MTANDLERKYIVLTNGGRITVYQNGRVEVESLFSATQVDMLPEEMYKLGKLLNEVADTGGGG